MEYEVYPRVEIDHDKIIDYEFSPNSGVSGILLPNGEFRKCGNAQHHLLTVDIDWYVQKKCVYFSMSAGWRDGIVTMSPNMNEFDKTEMTQEQLEWIELNKEYFDAWQNVMIDNILEELS